MLGALFLDIIIISASDPKFIIKDIVELLTLPIYGISAFSIILFEIIGPSTISLDEITLGYGIDQGLMVKILIKMYQITEELISKLVKINRSDLNDFLVKQKELLIRHPIKLESLYINN